MYVYVYLIGRNLTVVSLHNFEWDIIMKARKTTPKHSKILTFLSSQ